MKLTEIAAIGKNRELGKDNQLIWHFPQDLKFFKEQTKGHTIVMGRKTFESLPGMLPKRHHIVISKSGAKFPEEVEVFSSIDAFVDAYQTKEEEIFVIGGATIYKQMLSLCHRLILTEINQSYDADVFFPEFDKNLYHKKILNDIMENGVHYQHVEYRLKSETTRD
ncbi:dihydrofolate reductase [Faecalicoccus pleomorphus]|mgnify:FL=1|uniref:dihydrofolate reductase n=1 Tax=Faecalicoccus pleomorphus TaxID=1323 RepID=UPI0019601962|nr:dihydrofolate reductase [Faecalicoccus pleomorphus]MBM6677276.1 dihydrofolate reductase [Faecalicoccus pleomorphus]MBM6764499.1 dihydrofolate reductase [Faecalicoccus pleomorphus]MDB7986583.1 dihydrofolate reductase [Faecalicoccus pleomorphus]MDB7990676.1 dihydrofolate reductase [Faecalicoccus pleomorphus]MDM8292352.1 dihydrofolate reductase [Faecalicoccus pleomorphus]